MAFGITLQCFRVPFSPDRVTFKHGVGFDIKLIGKKPVLNEVSFKAKSNSAIFLKHNIV